MYLQPSGLSRSAPSPLRPSGFRRKGGRDPEHGQCCGPQPLDTKQRVIRCSQDAGQVAALFQEPLRWPFHVPPQDDAGKQEFEEFVVGQGARSGLQQAIPEALPMPRSRRVLGPRWKFQCRLSHFAWNPNKC